MIVREFGADDARHEVSAVYDGREILDAACVRIRAFEDAQIEDDGIDDHVFVLVARDGVDLARVDEHDVALMYGEPFVVDTNGARAFLHLDDLHFLVPVGGDARHLFAYHRAVLRERTERRPVDFVFVKFVEFLFVELG